MTAEIIYDGQLRTTATHLASSTKIETDAPVDNNGKGEKFSPTDLAATSLGACMMTVMGIAARDKNISLEGTRINITKIMAANPRRIAEVKVDITFPRDNNISQEDRERLEGIAVNCPVAKSLHPDIKQNVTFKW